jgi:hypothetical protein
MAAAVLGRMAVLENAAGHTFAALGSLQPHRLGLPPRSRTALQHSGGNGRRV